MPTIYVQNLYHKKAAVCRALLEAAANTEVGKAEKRLGIQSTADAYGLWEPLHDFQIEEQLWASRHSGFLLEVGYLQVKLEFKIDSVDVTYYEKTYGISATAALEAAGFTCSDKPISSASHSERYTPLFCAASKSHARPTSEAKSESKAHTNSTIIPYSKNIASDKRFEQSNQDGVIFKSVSMSYVTDNELRAYGAKRWDRKKDDLDHIVLILEMENEPTTSPQPKMK